MIDGQSGASPRSSGRCATTAGDARPAPATACGRRADERDLAKWAGLRLRDVRAGLTAIAAELVQRGDGLLELKGAGARGAARAWLLDQWDPLLVGWRSRDFLLGDYPRRDSPEAHFRPFAYVDGRAVATWGFRGGASRSTSPSLG